MTYQVQRNTGVAFSSEIEHHLAVFELACYGRKSASAAGVGDIYILGILPLGLTTCREASVRMTGVDGLDVASHLRKLKITLFAAFFMLCIDVDRRDGRDRSTSPRSEEQHLTADEH